MALVNTSKRYDHPQYVVRQTGEGGKIGPGTATPAAYLPAAQPLQLYQLAGQIQTAGTAAGAIVDAIKVEGTTTTTMASSTVGTAAAGGTFTIDLTTSGVAPTQLAAFGYAYAVTRADATVAVVAGWEYGSPAGSNIASPA